MKNTHLIRTDFGPLDKTALLIIDLQNDFLPGGALGVENSDSNILSGINALAKREFGLVVASRDQHPPDHCSFAGQGGPWPPHCIAGTKGAAFSDLLQQEFIDIIIDKGSNPQRECYSGFKDETGQSTGLSDHLRKHAIEKVVLVGIALDYCVKASALDSVEEGFETFLIPSLTHAVGEAAPVLNALQRRNVHLLSEEAFP